MASLIILKAYDYAVLTSNGEFKFPQTYGHNEQTFHGYAAEMDFYGPPLQLALAENKVHA